MVNSCVPLGIQKHPTPETAMRHGGAVCKMAVYDKYIPAVL